MSDGLTLLSAGDAVAGACALRDRIERVEALLAEHAHGDGAPLDPAAAAASAYAAGLPAHAVAKARQHAETAGVDLRDAVTDCAVARTYLAAVIGFDQGDEWLVATLTELPDTEAVLSRVRQPGQQIGSSRRALAQASASLATATGSVEHAEQAAARLAGVADAYRALFEQ